MHRCGGFHESGWDAVRFFRAHREVCGYVPILRKQLAEIEKGIENLVNAIQAGIFSTSTKQRLDELEAQKSEISVQILKEEIAKPTVTKEDMLAYLLKYRKLNMKQLDHRRR